MSWTRVECADLRWLLSERSVVLLCSSCPLTSTKPVTTLATPAPVAGPSVSYAAPIALFVCVQMLCPLLRLESFRESWQECKSLQCRVDPGLCIGISTRAPAAVLCAEHLAGMPRETYAVLALRGLAGAPCAIAGMFGCAPAASDEEYNRFDGMHPDDGHAWLVAHPFY